jgi:hypothetical protein
MRMERSEPLCPCRFRTSELVRSKLPKVPFFTLAGAHKDSRKSDFDGLLTLGLFRRVFINHAEHYAVLDPW